MLQPSQNETLYLRHYESPRMSHGFMNGIMGTRFDLLVMDKSREDSASIWESVLRELRRLHALLNRFDPVSEVSLVNRNACREAVQVSDTMWDVLVACGDYWRRTGGVFDITRRDFSALHLSRADRSVFFTHSDLSIDLGGFAKGFALKRVLRILLEWGVKNAFVDFGNSAIYGLGHHPYGSSWKVSISNPYRKGEIMGEFALVDGALSTSGNTPEYFGHIVHPQLGEKMMDRKMVCVESEDPVDAEVLSTAMMVAAPHQREKIIHSFPNVRFKEIKL